MEYLSDLLMHSNDFRVVIEKELGGTSVYAGLERLVGNDWDTIENAFGSDIEDALSALNDIIKDADGVGVE